MLGWGEKGGDLQPCKINQEGLARLAGGPQLALSICCCSVVLEPHVHRAIVKTVKMGGGISCWFVSEDNWGPRGEAGR